LALVILSLVFAGAALIRRWSPQLRALFLPTAVIGGFLVLALGPEGLGRLIGGNGIFSDHTFGIWRELPGLLVNVMAAGLLLGERLPPIKKIWALSGPHVIMAGAMSAGQFAIGSILVLVLLAPVFGMNHLAGSIIEMSFAGGHGTLAGLAPVLHKYGASEIVEVGLGLATIGMVTGVVIGTALINYAIRSPSIPVARQRPPSPDEDLDIDHHLPGPDDEPMDEWKGMGQVTAAVVFLGVSIAIGIVLHNFFRWLFNQFGSDFFDMFPLFPFAIIASVLIQLCAVKFNFTWAVNRRAVQGIGGLSVDGIIICAIGTLSLGALGHNIGPLLILSVASVAWSIFMAMVIGRRVFRQDWFEHSIAEYSESQGNVATGLMMVDMVDPDKKTGVTRGYNYRQLITRPMFGGGFISALSVPLIATLGLPAFTIGMAVITVAMIVWGIRRASTPVPAPALESQRT
jgi:ESS family glutamate:Na+ symporter